MDSYLTTFYISLYARIIIFSFMFYIVGSAIIFGDDL